MNKALPTINEIQVELNKLASQKTLAQAQRVILSVIRLLDGSVSLEDQNSFQLFADSDGKIRANGSWFFEDQVIVDRKATYKIHSENKLNIDFKLYGVAKPSKRTIAWAQALIPNFEDEPFNSKYNIGIDFIVPKSVDKVIIVLSNQYVIRTLELKGTLTVTFQEILAKWAEITDFSNKKEVHSVLWESFDLQPLNKKFYAGISERFITLRQHLTKEIILDDKHSSLFANRLIGRVIFCWFLDKKGVINPDRKYFDSSTFTNDTEYYRKNLENLFFGVLNTPIDDREYKDDVTPFLNGGLFEARDTDLYKNNKLTFPKNYFDDLFGFLSGYNFTTDESTSQFQQVAIDPEMLGRIFENLLAEMTEETGEQARKAKGAFYTPREIVDYMCRESLREYLKTKIPEDEFRDKRFGQLIDAPDKDFQDQDHNWRRDWKPYKDSIIKALDGLKVLDPACGSGAFPIGMLQLLVRVYERLEPRFDNYKAKLQIIENNIYGVDIEPMAVEIARLRAWLSIVVDEGADSKNIKPLPNLEFKFICANSLIDLDQNGHILGDDPELADKLQQIRDAYFDTGSVAKKKKLRSDYEKLVNIGEGLFGESFRSKQLKTYRPFDNEASSGFFNPDFIFGVKSFGIIVGNPPYVGEKGHKEIFRRIAQSSLGQRFYQRKMDLFYFFFHVALDYLQDGGVIAYVTTNYYITATGAIKLRLDIKERATVLQLINFGELKIFESALGQHNMITILKKGLSKGVRANTVVTNRKGYLGVDTISSIIEKKDAETNYFILTQDELYEGSNIKLTIGRLDSVLDKVGSIGSLLGDICYINMGVQTGADKIGRALYERAKRDNKIDSAKIGDRIYVLDSIDRFSEIEKRDLMKKHVKGSAISKYHLDLAKHEWLIYADSQVDISKYPNVEGHLLKYRGVLSLREQVLNTDEAWFRIRGAKRKYFINTGKHIICPYRSKRNVFAMTDGATYGSGDVYLISGIKNDYKIEFLLGILNSHLMYVWLCHRGKRKGQMLELYQEPLSKIPIPALTQDNQELVLSIGGLASEIISLKNKNKDFDTKDLENQIDGLVMDLYGLTDEEKNLIRHN